MAPEKKNDKPLRKTYRDFPQDVLEVILSRLPVKFLIRFKTVCKSWEAIISDRRFSELVRIQQSKNLFLKWRLTNPNSAVGSDCSLINLESNGYRTQAELGNPSGNCSEWMPVNSCNGIVLLKDASYGNVYALWNPSIRSKPARIPCPPPQEPSTSGLYYDSRTDDYKVVVFFAGSYIVFSCKTGIWTEKAKDAYSCYLCPRLAVFVDGSFYWWDYEEKLISFDVRDGKFEVLSYPHDLQAKDISVGLMVLSGRLCLISPKSLLLRLWVMEKDAGCGVSWKVLLDLEDRASGLPCNLPYLLVCLTEDDEVVMSCAEARVFVYDHRKKLYKESWRFHGIRGSMLLQCCETLDMPLRI